MEGYLLVAKRGKKEEEEGNGSTRVAGSEETKTKKVKGKCVYWKIGIDCDFKKKKKKRKRKKERRWNRKEVYGLQKK